MSHTWSNGAGQVTVSEIGSYLSLVPGHTLGVRSIGDGVKAQCTCGRWEREATYLHHAIAAWGRHLLRAFDREAVALSKRIQEGLEALLGRGR